MILILSVLSIFGLAFFAPWLTRRAGNVVAPLVLRLELGEAVLEHLPVGDLRALGRRPCAEPAPPGPGDRHACGRSVRGRSASSTRRRGP